MDASFNKGATLIALRPIPAVAGRSFAPGDVFPWRKLALSDRRVRQMVDIGRVGELTQKNWDFAMKQRPDGDLPRGHTEAGLEALGIQVAKAADAPAAAPDKPAKKPEAQVAYDGPPTEHRGYLIAPRKRGVVMCYDVFHVDTGADRLNSGGMLKGMKQVDGWIDQHEAEKARLAAATAPPTPAPVVDPAALGGEGYGDPPVTE